ncbi:hypothetical protein [Actinoplanes subglobosus]|uniref:Uncharacterized protein n=1 Tax=Actinoplanes subglobosus TaxID=1547892 RepID=A0ABV8J4Q0_9ACTN
MEILAGEGVALVKVGESRDVVESRVGPPVHPGRRSRAVYDTDPGLVITYQADETVELVEIGYGGEEVFFEGVQLTYRFIDDVVAELAARGHRAVPFDIGFSFEPGFAIFSMSSLSASELDPGAPVDDPRRVVEGVSVAPFEYFREPTEEEIEAYVRGLES